MFPVIFEYSVNLFDAILGTFFVMFFCGGRIKDNYWWVPCTLLCFAVSDVYLYISDFAASQSIIILGILLAYAFLSGNGSTVKKIVSPIIFELTFIINSTVMSFVFSRIFSSDLATLFGEASVARYLFVISSKVTLIILLLVILRFVALKDGVSAADIAVFLSASFSTVLIIYTFMRLALSYDVSRHFLLIILSVAALALVNTFSIIMLIRASRNAEIKAELSLMRNKAESEKKYYEESGRVYEETCRMRHDMKYRLSALRGLIDEGDTDKINKFFEESESLTEKRSTYVVTNNRMLDYIINTKISANPDIEFIVTGECRSLAYIDDLNIAVLFGNMLDNALEACAANGEKLISISFKATNGYQTVICKNPIRTSVLKTNKNFKSTKKGKGMHGYGIKSMRMITDKYDGFLDFYEEGHFFCVQVVLPLK